MKEQQIQKELELHLKSQQLYLKAKKEQEEAKEDRKIEQEIIMHDIKSLIKERRVSRSITLAKPVGKK